jgi:hypothetical protein
MNFKPYRDVSEHDVINGVFQYNLATGSQATPVVIVGLGWSGDGNQIAGNSPFNYPNITSPRWELKCSVRAAVSGEKPFGVMLFDVKELNQFGYPFIWDTERKEENSCVVSGEAVPIARKGLFVVGPFGTGVSDLPSAGKFAVVKTTGDWGAVSSKTGALYSVSGLAIPYELPVFGTYIGPKDADGYAAVYVNCY